MPCENDGSGGARVTTQLQSQSMLDGARARATGAAIATAAALLFSTLAVSVVSAAEPAKIKCQGVNSCKGASACATAQSACQGQNSCKGQGFVMLGKADCDAARAKIAGK